MCSADIRTSSRFLAILITSFFAIHAVPTIAQPISGNAAADRYLMGLPADQRELYLKLSPESQRTWINALIDLEERKQEIFRWQRLATGAALGAAAPWAAVLVGIVSITATPVGALVLTGVNAAIGAGIQAIRMAREYSKARQEYDRVVSKILREEATVPLPPAGGDPRTGTAGSTGAPGRPRTVAAPGAQLASDPDLSLLGVDMQN